MKRPIALSSGEEIMSLPAPPFSDMSLESFATAFRAGQIRSRDVTQALLARIDALLVHLEPLDPPRYRLLETTRLYAAERLTEHQESAALAQRHGQVMAVLADEAEADYWVMPDIPWLSRYAPEYDDFHAAFDRACQQGDGDVGAATLDALFRLDHLRAVFSPMHAHLDAAVGLLSNASPVSRGRLLLRLAAFFIGLIAAMPKLTAAREAVMAFRGLGDRRRLYEALLSLAANCALVDEFHEADNAVADASSLEDPEWPPRVHWLGAWHRGVVHAYRGDAVALRASSRNELAFAEQAGSPCQIANARGNVCEAALMAGDWEEAVRLGRTVVSEMRALDLPQLLALGLSNLCAAHLRTGDVASARAIAEEALPVSWQNDAYWGLLLAHLSLLAATCSQLEPAAQMIGYVETWFKANRHTLEASEADSTNLASEMVETVLGVAETAALRRAGALLTGAQAYALAEAMLAESVRSDARDEAEATRAAPKRGSA